MTDDWKTYIAQTSPWGLGLEVAEARGSRISAIQDGEARDFIDFISGIGVANAGHLHPSIRSAVHYQIERYAHTMVYGEHNQDIQVEYAKAILKYFPEESQVFFTNSGTEAMELALKMVIKIRKPAFQPLFITLKNGFHGRTFGAMAVSSNPKYKVGLPRIFETLEIDPVDERTWRIANDVHNHPMMTAFILELCQGEAGARLLPKGLVDWILNLRNKYGVPIIVDEVQTGFDRTGTMFLHEQFGFTPDITTLGKAIGGGLPLGAVVAGKGDFERLQDPPFSHVTTFGGNPVSCAAGKASLRVIEDILGTGHVANLTAKLDSLLQSLSSLYPNPVGYSGVGLLKALHFSEPSQAEKFVKGCFDRRVLVGYKLNNSTAVRLAPPLTTSFVELEKVGDTFNSVLRDMYIGEK